MFRLQQPSVRHLQINNTPGDIHMIEYVSTKGGISPVPFDEAVLQGFAPDGGLFVPETIPRISQESLNEWSVLGYTDLAFEVLSLFIDPEIIPPSDLKRLIHQSFSSFEHPDIMPIKPFGKDNSLFFMELFHGPTLSFKDIAMGFLINVMDYLLQKGSRRISLVLATTGDTGPAAAFAAAGKKTIDCWPLYPLGMISEEQERQMTTLSSENVHPVGVTDCPDGGDDLDLVVARLFENQELKQKLNLSSVNSINWCRVMVQAVHYMYGYFRVCDTTGDPVIFSVPSGAFGNLFAGFLARAMGVPVHTFICANNRNKTLHTAFTTGVFKKENLCKTVSSAIDIVVPYNFWRFLYFKSGCDPEKITDWMDQFTREGEICLDKESFDAIQKGYRSLAVSDQETLATIKETFDKEGYLLDPHGAVAVVAARALKPEFKPGSKILCLLTAHPAKFPVIIKMALDTHGQLPEDASHTSLIRAKALPQKRLVCHCKDLESVLTNSIGDRINKK
jgi:threonine synthase